MSLINNMLKDLEKRDTSNRDMPDIALINHKQQFQNAVSQKKIFLLSIFLPAFLAIVLLITFGHKHSRTVAPLLSSTENVKPVITPIATPDANWLQATSITGMTAQIKDHVTEVRFLMDHAPLYTLTSDATNTHVILTIEKTQLVSELPSVNYLNSAIERISTQTVNSNTKFIFTLYPGANIKYVNINDTDKNPELVVAVEFLPTATPDQISLNNNSVKTPALESLEAQQYQAALNAAEGGQFQLAIGHLTSLLATDPAFNDARVSLAALLIDQGNTVKAKSLIDTGLHIVPDYSPLIELKARIMTSEGKITEALALLQSAAPPINDNPDYHAFIAALYERTNNDTLASSLYRQLLAINPQNGNWWFGLGVSLDKLSNSKEAIYAYNKAIEQGHLNPDSIHFLQTRLQALRAAGANS